MLRLQAFRGDNQISIDTIRQAVMPGILQETPTHADLQLDLCLVQEAEESADARPEEVHQRWTPDCPWPAILRVEVLRTRDLKVQPKKSLQANLPNNLQIPTRFGAVTLSVSRERELASEMASQHDDTSRGFPSFRFTV